RMFSTTVQSTSWALKPAVPAKPSTERSALLSRMSSTRPAAEMSSNVARSKPRGANVEGGSIVSTRNGVGDRAQAQPHDGQARNTRASLTDLTNTAAPPLAQTGQSPAEYMRSEPLLNIIANRLANVPGFSCAGRANARAASAANRSWAARLQAQAQWQRLSGAL